MVKFAILILTNIFLRLNGRLFFWHLTKRWITSLCYVGEIGGRVCVYRELVPNGSTNSNQTE